MEKITSIGNQAAAGSIQEYLGGVRFPCSKDELLEDLRQHGAPDRIINQIEGLSANKFDSLPDVLQALQRG